ncbi:hypothetical protein BGZ47_010341 [Haplosporangium gracile]|nr:hypothetical protein BGZ47_010341 [Haplosporangium gracile]
MAAFSSLPQEVIDLIIPHLTQRDYASCVLVSQAWNTLFTPPLWRILRVVNETTNKCLKTTQGRTALARNRHHIREFETTYLDSVFFLATGQPVITDLVSLTIRLKDHRFSSLSTDSKGETKAEVPKSTVSSVIKILNNNPELRSLSLDRGCFRYKDDDSSYSYLIAAFPTAHLERLELSFFDASPRETFIAPPAFEPIASRILVKQFLLCFKELAQLHLAQERFHSMREIVITGGGVKGNYSDPLRLSFLVRCPNVKRVRLDRLDFQTLASLPMLLRMACPELDCLEWTSCNNDTEAPIIELLRTTTLGWKELRLPSMPAFGSLALAAVLETSAETLEVLRIENAGSLLRNEVLDLLSGAKELRRLEGAGDGQVRKSTKEFIVDAYDAYQEYVDGQRNRSWVLGPSMEYLQLSIQRVPRPDVVRRLSGGDLMFSQEGLGVGLRFEVQRWIYMQLSRMTGLKELVLGKLDFHPDVLAYCNIDLSWSSMDPITFEEALLDYGIHAFNYLSLELSLVSGLDMLEGLKELRVLDVRRTAHNIGVEELQWMHRNWPKLEKIRGLRTERGWSVHRDEGKEFKANVNAWMAAHPHGIGSSFYH